MKLIAVTLLTIIAAVAAGPINVSENNVGDIVNVGINANLEISNQVELNIIGILAVLLNQELGEITLPNRPDAPNVRGSEPVISREMVERIKSAIASRRQ